MRKLTDVLGELRKGVTLMEATTKFAELVQAVEREGRPGTFTLKLDVKPNKGTVLVFDEVAVKLPKPEKSASMFFPDADGGLHRRDPNQSEMPLAAVPPRANAVGE